MEDTTKGGIHVVVVLLLLLSVIDVEVRRKM